MNTSAILEIVKARLGISSTVRNVYLTQIIDSVVAELLGQQGLALAPENAAHQVFVADYVVWRYQSRDSSGAMPRHLQWRLHNLFMSGGD